jgi:pyrroloquinoline quinone (PQQ) biosynthesis protein C
MTVSVENRLSSELATHQQTILALAQEHACARHPLFAYLQTASLTVNQCAALLRNYDAHATVLRRLLLRAASIMPEKAVGFILENVRNEYGNGRPEHRHQLQLLSLATAVGVDPAAFAGCKIEPGVREYLNVVVKHYYPIGKHGFAAGLLRPAITAGAVTATEIFALEEFRAMQQAFARHGQGDHIWFDHVNVEIEHTDESLALAMFFIEEHQAADAVYFGLRAVLEANCKLYDGLLTATLKAA